MFEPVAVLGSGAFEGYRLVGKVLEFCDGNAVLLELLTVDVMPRKYVQEFSVVTGEPKFGCGLSPEIGLYGWRIDPSKLTEMQDSLGING